SGPPVVADSSGQHGTPAERLDDDFFDTQLASESETLSELKPRLLVISQVSRGVAEAHRLDCDAALVARLSRELEGTCETVDSALIVTGLPGDDRKVLLG